MAIVKLGWDGAWPVRRLNDERFTEFHWGRQGSGESYALLGHGTEGFKNLQRMQLTDPTGRPGRRKIYFGHRWRHWWPCAQRRSQAQYFQSLEMGVPYLWVRARLWHIEIKAETRGVCTAVRTPDDPRLRDFMRLLSSPPTVLVRIIRYHRGRCQPPLERITLVAPLTPVTPPRPTPVTPLKLLAPTSVSGATGPAYTNLNQGNLARGHALRLKSHFHFWFW